ncbi:hypothetical protein D1007_55124 [Hordeum vulgare]|nr:hypothetical protein D1007_55124 [Hordeum vulgare]
MISKFNWNEFTLKFFLSEIGKVLEDGRVREWPHGNLALLHKVQPIIGPKYDPLSLMSPLMRNWTEPLAEKTDKYDYDCGRGVGMRMIEKMNKSGVFYRTGNMEEEEENLYADINESTNDGAFRDKEFVYHSDMDDYRTPSHGKMHKQKDDDGGHENCHVKVPYYCTHEYLDSFKGDRSDPIKVPDVSDEKAVTYLETNEISSHGSGHYNGVYEQVEKGLGKHKRTASRAVKSPFVVVKPIKRAKHSAKAKLFNKEDVKKTIADVDVIKESVMFLRACERLKKHRATEIFNDGVTDALTTERACQILNHQWISGDRREIGAGIAEANATGSKQYPDVSTWPIKTYGMPQQEDG